MGKACCADGCTNRFTKGSGVSFYRFPKDPARRALWISAVDRKNWTPNAYFWIRSAHFVSGGKSDDPRICSQAICSHWESCQVESSRRPVQISKKSGPRCRKICAESGSSRSADEEDNKSDIGNGACERSIMTDLSGEDILKLQDEL